MDKTCNDNQYYTRMTRADGFICYDVRFFPSSH